MILVADTSGLIAALNIADPEHDAARAVLSAAARTVVSPLVFLEIEHVTSRNVSRRAALGVNDWLLEQARIGRVEVPAISADVLAKARHVQDRYDALRLDLTDAVTVVVAERYETEAVLTLDRRDFRAMAPLTGDGRSGYFPTMPDRPELVGRVGAAGTIPRRQSITMSSDRLLPSIPTTCRPVPERPMNNPMTPDQEYEFYAHPENQQPQGPARRRLTATVPVRFPADLLEQVRTAAAAEDRSVSSWIRRAVERELRHPA